jgi:hypothetical protein
MPRRFVVLTVGSLLALVGCWEGITRSVSATLLSTHGKVSFLEGSAEFRPLEGRSTFAAGAVLRTESDGQLDLVLIPGALAKISSDSELKIAELQLTKDGNETGDAMRGRHARVELLRGSMVVLFEGFARFKVDTHEVGITVLPSCLFRVDVDGPKTRLTVVRGKLYAAPKGGDGSALNAGDTREWSSEPGKSPTASASTKTTNPAEILETSRELQELASARRDRLPF